MFRKLQDRDPRHRTLQASPEVECSCQCKDEITEPRQMTGEAVQNSMYMADYYEKNSGS